MAKTTAPKKAAAKKATVKTTTTEKAAAKETAAKKAATNKTTATKKRATAVSADRTPPVKKAPAKKAVAKKAAKKAATAAKGAAQAAQQTGARTVGAKKTAGTSSAAGKGAATVPTITTAAATPPGGLAVRPGEDPWTPKEVAEARAELESEAARLTLEISSSEESVAGLMRDSGDGAGDDDADTGTKNITREHELALAANARDMLEQTERALLRLDAGTYGLCEVCGNPIGKARMQAFPRATLCVEDKQKQERRG
ncbi:TraR/DksA C4-type zinc finger protein [Streptomyces sp. NPDC023998]|uniref:TraR/DksA family transcriptional regulator n=1 Tax=Streptomyces sp. NPDC023998 TaxID=3154597 RepID=UPI003407BFD6